MAQRKLEVLSAQECLALLGQGRVGRLVFLDERGPVAIPVNYAMAGGHVVMRVEGGAKQAAMNQPLIAFEVDHLEDDQQAGWSVLVRGSGRECAIGEVPELLRSMDGHYPAPWAAGVHNVWLQIITETVTGRRFGDFQVAIDA